VRTEGGGDCEQRQVVPVQRRKKVGNAFTNHQSLGESKALTI